MSKSIPVTVALAVLVHCTGCDDAQPDNQPADAAAADSPAGTPQAPDESAAAPAYIPPVPPEPTPVTVTDGVATLGPDNTRIRFQVRRDNTTLTCGFADFDGTVEVDSETGALSHIMVMIETGSAWSEHEELTRNLVGPELFDAERFTTATFKSSAIEAAEDQTVTISGELALAGATAPVAGEGTFELSEKGLVLRARFDVDRTAFGLTMGGETINDTVTVTADVGLPTNPPRAIPADPEQQTASVPN